MATKTNASEPRAIFTRRTLALWALLLIQISCAAFFIADIVADLLGKELAFGRVDHHGFELIVVVALVFGVVLTGLEIRSIARRTERVEGQLKAAAGAFMQLLDEYFDSWALTPSEKDVAMLAIKGLSINEIAAIRDTKEGTIKAQCNAIYRKAGVSGRPQLLSVFIEELMGPGLALRRSE